MTENPPTLGELGGDCTCGRGPKIGTLTFTASRMRFRVFHDAPAAIAVATGEVRAAIRRVARERDTRRPT